MTSSNLEQRVKKMSKNYLKYLIIPDFHAPYEDYRAIQAVYEFAKDWRPDEIIMMGDHVDFYSLSVFDKNPERLDGLQKEIDVLHYHLDEMRNFHKGKITYLEGNHEHRLIRYLWKHPEMNSLRCVNNVPSLLDLDKYDIDYHQNIMRHGVLFKHGSIVRKHSGYTAKGELEGEGTSGVSGHTHRMGSHYLTNRSSAHAWYEMGHICDESKAEYMNGKIANWQKGFGVMVYDKNANIWNVYQFPIINNSFMAFNKTYSWRSNAAYPKREDI